MRKIFTILFLAVNSVLSATNYYVKNGGSDAATGTSDATAWAHHPWMSTWTGRVVLIPGDIVYMKRGDIWSIATPSGPYITVRQSGTAGSPITTTWYGSSGSKPLIRISGDYGYSVIEGYGKSYITFDNIDIEHFSPLRDLDNGQIGIKFAKDASSNVPHDWVITNCDIHNIPYIGIYGHDDSYNIIIGNTSAASGATPQSYSNHIYDCGYAGIILCGRDPVTNQSHFNICYNYIHDIDYGGGLRDAYGITFSTEQVGVGQGYSTGWPNYCIAKFNRIEDIPGHTGVDCHGGRNIYFQDNYIYNCLHAVIAQAADRSFAETAVLDNVYIERNSVENSGNSTLDNYVFIYIVAENVLHRATNCFINDNILFYTSRPSGEVSAAGISIYNVDGLTIEGNKIYNGPIGSAGGGILFYSTGENKVKNVIVKNNWIRDWDKGINLYTNSLDGDIVFSNNIIYSHRKPFVVNGGTISRNISLLNNTILTAASALQPYVVDFVGNGPVTIENGATLTLKNNILGFTSTSNSGSYILAPATINGSFTCDYNLFWNSTSATPFFFKGTYHKWADWNAHGYDSHSLYNQDPLFKNKSGSFQESSDIILQNTSPAINKGTVLNEVPLDFFGNPRGADPDIGAYEYSLAPPVVVTHSAPNCFSGFVGEIDASGSYDPNNDEISFLWLVPDNIPYSSRTDSKIQFLSPILKTPQIIEFTLILSNGKATCSKVIPVGILPYKQELEIAEVLNVEARDFQSPNSPNNLVDGNIATMWSANGDNQWVILELKEPVKIQYIMLAFLSGQKKESYFDILGSNDKVIWEPILTKSISCSFSGDNQIFDFPPSKTEAEFRYIKLVGHCNSEDSWNYFSEFQMFGSKPVNKSDYEEQAVRIYPNPANKYINLRIDEPKLEPDFIRISNLQGKLVFQDKLNPGFKEINILINLINGIYLIQLGLGKITLFTQKIIVIN